MSFLTEMKRRKVFQVTAAYVVVAWLIVQVVDSVSEPLHLPAWFDTVVIVLLAVGFPFAVILAWIFDATPGGIKRTKPAGQVDRSVAVVPRVEVVERDKSIVVLPFLNMSQDPCDEYFSDGLTEELINSLVNIPGLQVAARTSSFAFKSKNKDVREIGRELNVGNVLEGSVRHAGDRLRVTAQLIDVSTGYHLWSDQFDKTLADIFEIQEDIARAIATTLEIKLGIATEAVFTKRGTENVDALRAFMLGRYCWNRRTADGLSRSSGHFNEAIEHDPLYADAYAGLADSFALQGIAEYGLAPPKDMMPKAKAAALKALEIDARSVEAQTTLAHVAAFYDWNWDEAERAFLKAIDLDSSYAFSHHWYALFLSAMQRHDEAIAHERKAQELEPLSLIINKNIGTILYLAHRDNDARDAYDDALALDPTYARTLFYNALALNQRAEYERAIEDIRKALQSDPTNSVFQAFLAYACARAGLKDKANEIRKRLIEEPEGRYVPAFNIAIVDLGLENIDSAMEWLQCALDERSSWLVSLNVDPIFDELREHATYDDLAGQIGLKSSR